MTGEASIETVVLHVPASSVDWAGILAQFAIAMVGQENQAFATWAAERLLRMTRSYDGVVALADGQLCGLLLFEVTDDAVELTFPWTMPADAGLAERLAAAALQVVQVVQAEYPGMTEIRAERQLLPGTAETASLEAVGFLCHWRWRMLLEMEHRSIPASEVPLGYRLVPWQIAFLDIAADEVYRANLGTLDALLYAPFFGKSPAQCRKGLLSILAGRYGQLHPRASLCAFYGQRLAGINLVLQEGDGLASVVEISVDPDHQGNGVGRALLVRSLNILKQEQCARVELAVTKGNAPAIHLYESLGFTPVSDFPVCVWPKPLP